MKYNYFKRYKFYTLVKYFDSKKNYVLSFFKPINIKKYNFTKFYKFVDIKKFNFTKLYKYLDLRNYNFTKLYKYLDLRNYNFRKYSKILNLKKNTKVINYFLGVFFASVIIYLSIPAFFNFEKTKIENEICKNTNFKCSISGKINYSIIPTPRINIKNLSVQDIYGEKKILGKIKNTSIKFSLLNLHNKKKINFKKIELSNAEINIDLKTLKYFKKFKQKNFKTNNIYFKKMTINFLEDDKYIANITDANLKYKPTKKLNKLILKGKFLEDNLLINFQSRKDGQNPDKKFLLKLPANAIHLNINLLNSKIEKNLFNGNLSFKKDKNKLNGNFNFKENKVIFDQINLRNNFLDGKLSGVLNLIPYFNFDLNVDLFGMNFNKVYGVINNLNDDGKKKLFKINKKINGKINFSSNKIYSKYDLVDSFESRIQFINGDILIDQLLLNLGKLGAADVTGIIKNDEKFSNLRFDTNIFLDDLKRFYRKFGIFNKKETSTNLFISGNFDLINLKLLLNEIFHKDDYKKEDIIFIEKEFNDIVLEEGYITLFDFLKFKEFVKLIVNETN